jgi:hypothetical protein
LLIQEATRDIGTSCISLAIAASRRETPVRRQTHSKGTDLASRRGAAALVVAASQVGASDPDLLIRAWSGFEAAGVRAGHAANLGEGPT